jgi:hypothetical protein
VLSRRVAMASAFVLALTALADGAPRRKPAAPRPEPRQAAREQDEYRSCDVAVRDFVQGRKEATALPVTEVRADGLRMTLNFVHPYGESGDTTPNLSFTRGESIEERRKALNEAKQRARVLVEAARTGNVWYVVALDKEEPDKAADARRNPASSPQPEENRTSANAAVFANVENRCIGIYEFKSVALETLGPDLRALLGDKSASSPLAGNSAAAPAQ